MSFDDQIILLKKLNLGFIVLQKLGGEYRQVYLTDLDLTSSLSKYDVISVEHELNNKYPNNVTIWQHQTL